MKKWLLALFAVLVIGCAGTSVKNVHEMQPSDYISCDSFTEVRQECASPSECDKAFYWIGGQLASKMRETDDGVAREEFNVYHAHLDASIIGVTWTELRDDGLWLMMDAIRCEDGVVVDQKRNGHKFGNQ